MRILHISILNPVTHSRIFAKEAVAAARAGHAVYVLGAADPAHGAARSAYRHDGVVLWPHSRPQGVWQRIRLQLCLLYRLWRIRPRLVQLHSPELLPLALCARWLLGCRLVYDQHEDYLANLTHGAAYAPWYWPWVGQGIRLLEHLSVAWVDAAVQAEACYAGTQPHAQVVYVPNKALATPRPPGPARRAQPPLRVLLSGTLAADWGVEAALALVQAQPFAHSLTLAGHAPHPAYARQLEATAARLPRVQLVGGQHYVPHSQLLACMASHDLGLALYSPQPAIATRIPTKFYEYMAAGLPFLYTDSPAWDALNAQTGMGLAISRLGELADFLARYRQPATRHWQWDAQPLLLLYQRLLA
jgi:glycogen(starch) synthase